MDRGLKTRFLTSWERHFNGAELPISFYYTDREDGAGQVPPSGGAHVHDRRACPGAKGLVAQVRS
jgi:hypothetical protein